jgi:hypothetical protein
MKTVIVSVTVAALLALLAGGMASAQSKAGATRPSRAATEAYAQSRTVRPRTRITVRAYPYRTYSTTFPVPYPVEYPGPGYVRQCSSRLVTENRVAGPVIYPRMRCWWEPGISDLKSYP